MYNGKENIKAVHQFVFDRYCEKHIYHLWFASILNS